MSAQFHWNPDTYVDAIRAEVPLFDVLQDQAIAAVEGEPVRVLDLGIGTGETSRRLLKRFPGAQITGLDSSQAMVFRARELGIEVRLARMEDPLPDGPWDLVISVLAIHHLQSGQKQDLFRRVKEHAGQLVIGDVVAVPADQQTAPLENGVDFPDPAADVAVWCDGEVVWSEADLAVIRAAYSA